MPALVQICIVVATLAVVAIAVAAVRTMTRAQEMSDRFTGLTGEIQQWTLEANALTREARDTVASVRGVIAPVRRVVDRFEALGERAAKLSTAVFEEIEPPLLVTMAVARGVRSATASLMSDGPIDPTPVASRPMEGLMMNENRQVNGTPGSTGTAAAIGFVVGAVVGAGIALLLAPGSGKETRRRLADSGRRWGHAARSRLDQALDTAHDLEQDVNAALEAGRDAFEHGQKSHEPGPTSRTELKR